MSPDLLLQACQLAGLFDPIEVAGLFDPIEEPSEPLARSLFLPRPFPRDTPVDEVFVTAVVPVSSRIPHDRCPTPTMDEWYSRVDPAEYEPVWSHRVSLQ